MSVVAIIPARANSKRLPQKNLLPFAGSTLVERAVQCARQSGIFEQVWVSSEDVRVEYLSDKAGARYRLRPQILCDDRVETASVVFDLLAYVHYRFDSFCVLNPTSPLRTPEMLRQIHAYFIAGKDPVMTSCDGRHDGTAIFCPTLDFLRALDFHKLVAFKYFIEPTDSIDIDAREQFDRAERIVVERESISNRAAV